jgi:hypothetical protein
VPNEVHWLLHCEDGTNFDTSCANIEQQATNDANAKVVADDIAFDTLYWVDAATESVKYEKDVALHDIVFKRQAQKKQEDKIVWLLIY